jgi:hypothetical protein
VSGTTPPGTNAPSTTETPAPAPTETGAPTDPALDFSNPADVSAYYHGGSSNQWTPTNPQGDVAPNRSNYLANNTGGAPTGSSTTPSPNALGATPPKPPPGGTTPLNAGATVSTTSDGKRLETVPVKSTKEVTIKEEITYRADANNVQQPIDHQIVLQTGGKDDKVRVSMNPDRSYNVNVNGETHNITLAQNQRLTIRTGGGNDNVFIEENVRGNITIEGEEGDDTLTGGGGDDKLFGGSGNDTLRGGGGNDYISGGIGNDTVNGGEGNDVIYGGRGNDTLHGNAGNDYIEGGHGNDELFGGNGNDILSGGLHNDTITTGAGNDTVYAGRGNDTVINNGGKDRAFVQRASDHVINMNGGTTQIQRVELNGTPGSRAVRVEGSAEFRERVQDDLEMLRSSPAGREMLQRMDAAYVNSIPAGARTGGNMLTIRELQNEHNGYASAIPKKGRGPGGEFLRPNGTAGPGADARISYNPSLVDRRFHTPTVVLYHEMAHAYGNLSGTMQPGTYRGANGNDPGNDTTDRNNNVPNSERQAVGLPNDGVPFRWNGNSSTPPNRQMPEELTENGFRRELGLPLRPRYSNF